MKLKFGGGDGKVIGYAESKPNGTIAFTGDGAEAIKEIVGFHVENLVTERRTDQITADEVLAYVLDRMAAKENWAAEVKDGDDDNPVKPNTVD